jgi:DNA-binding helix-hairpin-helix protein with protein kinase domain
MNRERALQVVLTLVGLIFLVGVYPLMMFLWPSGWRWQPNQPEYEQMILGVYATLGVFLLIASRRPAEHRSLIAFTAWSSLVHAGIMTVQALSNAGEHGHLLGDVPQASVVCESAAADLVSRNDDVITRSC